MPFVQRGRLLDPGLQAGIIMRCDGFEFFFDGGTHFQAVDELVHRGFRYLLFAAGQVF